MFIAALPFAGDGISGASVRICDADQPLSDFCSNKGMILGTVAIKQHNLYRVRIRTAKNVGPDGP